MEIDENNDTLINKEVEVEIKEEEMEVEVKKYAMKNNHKDNNEIVHNNNNLFVDDHSILKICNNIGL